MIEKYDKDWKEKLGKTAYYIALSAMQKCIRRSYLKGALNWGKIAWSIDPYALYRRLWTVLFEDCGRDLPSLALFHSRSIAYSNFESIRNAVKTLCLAQKSRECGWMRFWMEGKNFNHEYVDRYMGERHYKQIIDLGEGYRRKGLAAYCLWDFGVGDTNFDWVIDLATTASKFDHEKFSIGMPYWFMNGVYDERIRLVNECESITLFQDFLPLEAIDWHTRPGQHTCRMFAKYRESQLKSLGLIGGAQMFGNYMFVHEGWKYRNACPYYSIDVDNIGRGMEYWSEIGISGMEVLQELGDSFEEIHFDLHKCREWILKTHYAEDVENMKKAYFTDFLEE